MHGNINGGRPKSSISSVDFYRRVPKDLTEATTLGAAMSLFAMMLMGLLFSAETLAFARSKIYTEIALDDNTDPQIQLNFNITLFDLHCDYVSVDVWDVLGTNRQNVTKNIEKWQTDRDGVRKSFSGRNRDTRELKYEVHEQTLEEMHENGIHAILLDDAEHFDAFMAEHEMAMINFFAPWCMWCQRLHPTWEKFAEEVEAEGMPVGIASVNCQDHPQLCIKEGVGAFPTLKWYEGGKYMAPDYKADRTVDSLVSFANRKLQLNEKLKNWHDNDRRTEMKKMRELYSTPDNPGCQVSGTLMVNRVPGNFHIEAKSKNHNLNSAMTNLTHRVNHLSFGEMGKNPSRPVTRALKQVPESLQQFSPLDNQMYLTNTFHTAWHHYIKIVSTHLNIGSSKLPTLYQFLEQSQIVQYEEYSVPEARFSYDLSPMAVVVEKSSRKWYDYLTSLSAIIGGTFTTLGLIDAVLYKVFKPKKL